MSEEETYHSKVDSACMYVDPQMCVHLQIQLDKKKKKKNICKCTHQRFALRNQKFGNSVLDDIYEVFEGFMCFQCVPHPFLLKKRHKAINHTR